MPHALDGVKVIEMATYAPANMAAQWLGDLGADVLVVEPPFNRALGDAWSTGDRFRPETNRNKRGISLDLRQPEAREILHKLVADADILIEANRPGVAKRLGYDYETLEQINPRIIVCSLTGYGQEGPYRMLPGHGLVWEATGGWLMMQSQGLGNMGGDYTGTPWVNYFNLPDIKSAPYTFGTILAALYAREKTGEGQYLDLAIFDSVIGVKQPDVPERGDGAYARATPGWNVYQCKDGNYIATCAVEELQWANLCTGVGLPELAQESQATGDRAEQITALLQGRFRTRPRDEWFDELSKLDTEIARVHTLEEAADNPQVKLRNMHVEVTDDEGYHDTQYGTPFKLSKTPARLKHRRAPKLGEHTDQVMADLGYSQADIEKLAEAGTIIRRRS